MKVYIQSLILGVLISMVPCFATSLWGKGGQNFTSKHNPQFQTGDILQINIQEEARASNNSKTEVKDQNRYESDVFSKLASALTGVAGSSLGGPGRALGVIGNNLSDSASNTTFTGEGKLTQNSTLDSYMSVMIKQILPNGNLYLEGSKSVQVNGEKQEFKVTGHVRPEDVVNNQVNSQKIANAQIEMIGKGTFQRSQKGGFLQKIFGGLL